MFVKMDTNKSGNVLPKSPKSLPLKEKNFSHTFFDFYVNYRVLKETVRGAT